MIHNSFKTQLIYSRSQDILEGIKQEKQENIILCMVVVVSIEYSKFENNDNDNRYIFSIQNLLILFKNNGWETSLSIVISFRKLQFSIRNKLLKWSESSEYGKQ